MPTKRATGMTYLVATLQFIEWDTEGLKQRVLNRTNSACHSGGIILRSSAILAKKIPPE